MQWNFFVLGVFMELSSNWARLTGDIDAVGVNIKEDELISEYFCFAEKKQNAYKSMSIYGKQISFEKLRMRDELKLYRIFPGINEKRITSNLCLEY